MNVNKSSLTDLKDNIKTMSEDEIKKEKPYKIVNIIEEIQWTWTKNTYTKSNA